MKLYTAKATPFGRTVEVVAHELGLHEDLEIVATSVAPTTANAEFQAINPLRKIPALVTEEGMLVVDSPVIAEYLCGRVGDTRLFARGAPDHLSVMVDYALARGIAECAVAARYEMAVRPEGSNPWATSTRSVPTIRHGWRSRMISISSAARSPHGSGAPVPGASDGSSTSTSMVT